MHLAKSRSAFRIFIFISVIALSAGCHGGSGGSGGDPGDTKGEDVTWKISSISVQSVTDGQPVVEETYTFTYDKEAQTVREVYLSDQGNDSQLSTFTRTDTGWTCHYEIDSGRNGSVNITSETNTTLSGDSYQTIRRLITTTIPNMIRGMAHMSTRIRLMNTAAMRRQSMHIPPPGMTTLKERSTLKK